MFILIFVLAILGLLASVLIWGIKVALKLAFVLVIIGVVGKLILWALKP